MIRKLFIVLLFLCTSSYVLAGTVGIIGDSTLGAGITDSAGWWCGSFAEANKGTTIYTAGSNEKVTEVWLYTRGTNASATADVAIYTVNGSSDPDSLYGSSTQTFTTTAGTTTQWYSITGLNISLISGEDYCIAIGNATVSSVKRMLTSSAPDYNRRAGATDCSLATPFNTGSSSQHNLLFYAVVESSTSSSSTVVRGVHLRGVHIR